jgi:hypothetical protein
MFRGSGVWPNPCGAHSTAALQVVSALDVPGSPCAAYVLLVTKSSLRLYPAGALLSGSRSTLCKERFETAQDAAMLLTPSAGGGAGVVTWTASKGLLVRHP